MRLSITLIAEFDPSFPPHLATEQAVAHSAAALDLTVDARWLSTDAIDVDAIARCDGIWIGPGSRTPPTFSSQSSIVPLSGVS